MVYKKYSVRNGKLYGPYLYENRRVGGKVVTTYLGPVQSRKEVIWVAFFIAILLLFICVLVVILFLLVG